MLMSPAARKLALTIHVTSSVGWLGTVAAFLVLAVAGVGNPTSQPAHADYAAMAPIAWVALLPLATVSLLSGVVSSVGTRWGLIRFYWVLVKLLLAPFSTLVLLVHMQPIDRLAEAASDPARWSAGLQNLQWLMVTASGAAALVLVGLTVLSIYKPQGLTPHGARKLRGPVEI